MTPAGIETGIGRTWCANQSALGTQALIAAASTLSLRKRSNDTLKDGKTHGREPYVDGVAWDSSTPYVDAVGGDVGDFEFHAQIETGSAVMARNIGVDTVTGGADPWTHTISTGTAGPVYQTLREKTGQSVGPLRLCTWDAIHNDVTFNIGHDQNLASIKTGIQALKAGEIFTADPSAADIATDPWRWGEAAGACTIGGTPFTETAGESLELNRNWVTQQGDNVEPAFFVPGRGVARRSFSMFVTDGLLPQILLAKYGTATPTAGQRPTTAPQYASLQTVYTRSVSRTLTIATPKVEVVPDDIVIGSYPQGGLIPVTFGGQALISGGTPAVTITAKTGDSVSYVA